MLALDISFWLFFPFFLSHVSSGQYALVRSFEFSRRHAVQWGFPDRVRPYRTGFTTYDISWYAGRIDVVIMILPGPSPPAAKVLTIQDLKRFKQLLGGLTGIKHEQTFVGGTWGPNPARSQECSVTFF